MKTYSLPSVGLFILALGSLFGAACGSEVQGGSTSSSSSSGSGSSSSGSSTGDPALDCADACHKYETLNCSLGGSDCNTLCTEQIATYPMECADQVAGYFACLAQNTTSCDFPTACNSAEMALDSCQAMYGCASESTCFGGGGMMGESTCGCEETCKGQSYSTSCTTPAGSTMTTCDCLVDGTSVGTCQQNNPDACGAQDSCCNATYFNL